MARRAAAETFSRSPQPSVGADPPPQPAVGSTFAFQQLNAAQLEQLLQLYQAQQAAASGLSALQPAAAPRFHVVDTDTQAKRQPADAHSTYAPQSPAVDAARSSAATSAFYAHSSNIPHLPPVPGATYTRSPVNSCGLTSFFFLQP